jgi:hypothetical protein
MAPEVILAAISGVTRPLGGCRSSIRGHPRATIFASDYSTGS